MWTCHPTMGNHDQLEASTVQELKDIANKLRIRSVLSTQASNSGHPTSCSSIAEIMSVLFFHAMRYKVLVPKDPSNDRFILSKGHAAPILYAAWAEIGLFPLEDLQTLRQLQSNLEGHPTPRLNFIDVATGSLGQGLAIAAGMAFVGRNIDKANYRVYCLIGDGESAEGSVWESLHFAAYYKLHNLCAIFDINRLGQSGPTCLQHNTSLYKQRLEAFGWNVIVVDGHNVEDLVKAFHVAGVTKNKPTALVAKTLKGKHFPNIENTDNWHGKPLGDETEMVVQYLGSLIMNQGPVRLYPPSPEYDIPLIDISNIKLSDPPAYKIGEYVATRAAYGIALVKLARDNFRVIALDADTKNSTYSENMRMVFPERFIECFIAEQNMVGVAIGATCRDRTVAFVSTFAAFLTRAFDQIRMGAISQTNVNFVGSHCGVSIGQDGPSQMGLEDIAMFRAIPGSTIFYPSDAVACERAVELAANRGGICYIRTNRPATAIIYSNNQQFHIGKAHVVKKSEKDQVLVIAAGVTLHEALVAAEQLVKSNIHLRVLDPFTVKPIDGEAIIKNAADIGGRIITVEDHYLQGGLGEAVLSVVSEERNIVIKRIAVRTVPCSGTSAELLEYCGISANYIVNAVLDILRL